MKDFLTILTGDCREILPTLPAESVHCCVTSPPYWGLRDYGVDGQMGLEKTVETYVAGMVEVFREVKRVLREDGTLWLNMGDSYCSAGGHSDEACNDRRGAYNLGNRPEHDYREFRVRPNRGRRERDPKNAAADVVDFGPNRAPQAGLKPKDLCGMPWRLAFALQADGWWLRQDIIWHKPNPMPESVTDRCTKAHEYLFLLSKSARYYFDQEAIKEESVKNGQVLHAYNTGAKDRQDVSETNDRRTRIGLANWNQPCPDKRNKRSVWTVPSAPYSEAHFATFPPDLIKPCVLAGCPLGGTVLDPFGGSGTTGMVALELGRNAVLIELNPDYVKLAEKRCHVTRGLPL